MKNIYIVRDFNPNLLDFDINKKVQTCLNLIHQNSFVPTINTTRRITRKTSTIIDNILTNFLQILVLKQ